MQRMIQEQHPAKLVLIIYRRTLARDIMQNFTSLGFKYYVDSCDDPQVWESLLVLDFHIDRLLTRVFRNGYVLFGEALTCDMNSLCNTNQRVCCATLTRIQLHTRT